MLAVGILGLILTTVTIVLTGLILWTQRQNKIERRHGEIAQLKSHLLSRAYNLRQRKTSNIITCQTVRLELRRLPDSKDKLEAEDATAALLGEIKAALASDDKFIAALAEIDTRKMNSTTTLLNLQRLNTDELDKLERSQQVIDDTMVSILAEIRPGLKD